MNVQFFIGDSDWTARARIFTAAAHGLAERGHDVSIACPPGPIVDRVDTKSVDVVRIDASAGAAMGTFDFRRVAQERSLDIVFVHTSREQLMVGSGFRFGKGGRVVRRLGMFETNNDEAGLFTSRMAPARTLVTTNAEAAKIINSGRPAPLVAPVGADCQPSDAVTPISRRELHLRDDAVIVACPYAPNGRVRLLNVMRALSLLAPRHPRLRAVVFGERATDDDIRMQAAALGVAPLMQFVRGSTVDPVALMKASDAVWIAADHDAAALGCLDAMCAARPIIAERSETIDHFVADGINGSVLPEGESAMFASAISSVLTRSEVRVGYGNAGRSRVQRELGLTAMIDGFEHAAQSAQPMAAAR